MTGIAKHGLRRLEDGFERFLVRGAGRPEVPALAGDDGGVRVRSAAADAVKRGTPAVLASTPG